MNNKISSQQVTRSLSGSSAISELPTKGTMKNSGAVSQTKSIEQTKTPEAVTFSLEVKEHVFHKDQSDDSPVTHRSLRGFIYDGKELVKDAEGSPLKVSKDLKPGKEYSSADLEKKMKSLIPKAEAEFIKAVNDGLISVKNAGSIKYSLDSRPAHYYTTGEKTVRTAEIKANGNGAVYIPGGELVPLAKPFTGKLTSEQVRQEIITGHIEINQEKLLTAQESDEQLETIMPVSRRPSPKTPVSAPATNKARQYFEDNGTKLERSTSFSPDSGQIKEQVPERAHTFNPLLRESESADLSQTRQVTLPHVHTRKENQAWIAGAVAALVGGIAALAVAGVAKGNDPQDTVDSLDATADELDNAANELEANRDAIIQKAGEQAALDLDVKERGEAWEAGIAAYDAGDTDTAQDIFNTQTLDPDAAIQQEVISLDGAITDQIDADAEVRAQEVEKQVSAHIDNTVDALRSKATAQRVQADILAEQAKKVATDADTEFAFGALGLAAGIAFSAKYLLNHHHNSQSQSSHNAAFGEVDGQRRFNGTYLGGDSVVEVKA